MNILLSHNDKEKRMRQQMRITKSWSEASEVQSPGSTEFWAEIFLLCLEHRVIREVITDFTQLLGRKMHFTAGDLEKQVEFQDALNFDRRNKNLDSDS